MECSIEVCLGCSGKREEEPAMPPEGRRKDVAFHEVLGGVRRVPVKA